MNRVIKLRNIIKPQNTNLLKEMVRTDFKLRYQNSVIGYFWSLLKPLFMFTILYFVFTKALKIGSNIPGYPVYLLTGVLMWSFFAETTNRSVSAIVSRGNLIRKISIPKYLIVVSGSINSLINLALGVLVLLVFIYFASGTTTSFQYLLFAPLLILELFVLATAISFILSAMFVKFRDVSHLWEVILQGLFYATPIIYPLEIVPTTLQKYMMINPVAQIIQDLRWVLVRPQTTQAYDVLRFPYSMAPFLVVLFVSIIAIFYFKSQSVEFAENV